jgi:hypothetical protein
MNRAGLLITGLLLSLGTHSLLACCAVSKSGSAVVNADQTVLIIWNPLTKMQHFVRKASFNSDTTDIGFLVPSPTKPDLSETENIVFTRLQDITKPEIEYRDAAQGMSCGCGENKTAKSVTADAKSAVSVLEQKRVAGYDASVLRADSGEALTDWLKENGYEYSDAVALWAKPYIDQKWVFTALKIAPKDSSSAEGTTRLESPALCITFATEQPLFPYREPKSDAQAAKLQKPYRDLSIFFLSDRRYDGALGAGESWTGKSVWANELKAQQIGSLLQELKLPANAFPEKPWLTEFTDRWPYDKADSDLQFSVAAKQTTLKRDPEIIYRNASVPQDITIYALATVMLWPMWRRKHR